MPDALAHSFFLSPVVPDEVLNEVKKFKSKKSYGYDNVDMNVLKGVIDHIVEPITHICNRYFEAGIFPDDMKIAKVFLPLNLEKRTILITIDQYLYCHNFQKC